MNSRVIISNGKTGFEVAGLTHIPQRGDGVSYSGWADGILTTIQGTVAGVGHGITSREHVVTVQVTDITATGPGPQALKISTPEVPPES